MFCPECGAENPDNAKFCIKCRYDMRKITPVKKASALDPLDVEETIDTSKLGLGALAQKRYKIIEERGSGGMGVVYKAYDQELEIDVALKVLPEELNQSERALHALKREAIASARLNHPNIVRIYNTGEDIGRRYISMEWIDGSNLIELIDKKGKQPIDKVISYMRQICEALSEAHNKGVIHRDVKSSNIMVTSDGQIKVTDFGIARVVKDTTSRLSQEKTSGTLAYMSPEQLEGRRVDERSDIYSLGCTLYELLTGDPPFTTGDLTHQHLHIQPRPLTDINPEISEHLNEIVLKCLAKEPAKRFQNVAELSSHMDRRSAPRRPEDKKFHERLEQIEVGTPIIIKEKEYFQTLKVSNDDTIRIVRTSLTAWAIGGAIGEAVGDIIGYTHGQIIAGAITGAIGGFGIIFSLPFIKDKLFSAISVVLMWAIGGVIGWWIGMKSAFGIMGIIAGAITGAIGGFGIIFSLPFIKDKLFSVMSVVLIWIIGMAIGWGIGLGICRMIAVAVLSTGEIIKTAVCGAIGSAIAGGIGGLGMCIVLRYCIRQKEG